MRIYGFTAVVDGLEVNDDEQVDRLYTDEFVLVPAAADGVTTLDVEVEAASGEDALKIFYDHICQVEGITVERIDEDLVNTTEIAVRLGVSRETPRTWAAPESVVGIPFPKHRTVVGSSGKPQRLWCWADVYAWAATTKPGSIKDLPVPLDAAAVTWFNAQMLRQVEPSTRLALYFIDFLDERREQARPRERVLGEYSNIDYTQTRSTLYHSRADKTMVARQTHTWWLAGAG